ncbi:fungal-specific transcription factor domain-containing protein [Boeremia exigua]|uniref:fungal-specific transcription factor domain-containing protein n=1 Tax=Boeremia exigua TaxID=749465 RepID=UPI001E8CF054|nr:fungal-specific transcription factor domain-containing protein [Boeremia exigua]KAH6642753.1 fungal-specific transcription factor domain-containing protein [Boeremia exigua]
MSPQDPEASSVPEHGPQEVPEETRGTLKRKRAKYASRACHYCQRRKIKCDGADPCRPCLHRDQPCHRPDGEAESSKNGQMPDSSASDPMISFLLRRLVQLEERMERPDANNVDPQLEKSLEHPPKQLESPQASHSPTASQSKRMRESQGVMWEDGSPFAGETSVRYSLELMEDRLNRLGVNRLENASSPPPTQTLTPAIRPSTPDRTSLASRGGWRSTGNMRQLLDSHGLVFQLDEWKSQLETYFAEVHPLYPFLFAPSTWDTFNELWAAYASNTPMPISANQDLELQLAILFLCLATGRCTTANRKQNEARHSAGWSLYCVANELIGDVLNLCGSSNAPTLQLQTLLTIVVYLFRLDANERAQNVLALVVSHAHTLGINRGSISAKVTAFEDEMFRRIWWCIYVIDKRLCLETGRPFLIMDMNTDAALPSDVDDVWMSEQKNSARHIANVSTTPGEVDPSPIAYLKAMIGYSRISSKVWEAVYAAPVAKQPLSDVLREYVEISLDQWRQALPTALIWTYSESHGLSDNPPRDRQRFLLHLRYNYMKLMIRKPSLQRGAVDLERNITSIAIADLIISEFLRWHEDLKVLTFPYVRYLLGATIASLSIIISEPSLYDAHISLVVSAAELLKTSCYESWVSGKTTRTTARVYSVVQSMRHLDRSPSSARVTNQNQMHSMQTRGAPRTAHPHDNSIKHGWVPGEISAANPLVSPVSSGQPVQEQALLAEYGMPAEFIWPDLNMDEFDFEASLRGRDLVEVPADTWLDGLSFTPVIPLSHAS